MWSWQEMIRTFEDVWRCLTMFDEIWWWWWWWWLPTSNADGSHVRWHSQDVEMAFSLPRSPGGSLLGPTPRPSRISRVIARLTTSREARSFKQHVSGVKRSQGSQGQVSTRFNTSRAARGGGGSFKNRKCIGEIGCCESRMTKRKHWWIWLTAELSNWLTDKLAS